MDAPSSVCSATDRHANASQARSPHTDRGSHPPAARESDSLDTESSSAHRLQHLYDSISVPLQEVEARLIRELQSPYESIAPVLSHGTQLGGKRLRPAMLLLCGSAVGKLSQQHVVLGTVIEMVHTATLVHDDVLDQAETRRHVATINARWNEHTSILLGDYLFAQSFRLAATLPSTEACRMIGEAARLVCEGELRQILQRDMLDLDEEAYLSVIGAKTGELCRVACQLGAQFAGGDQSVVEAMGAYGHAVGIAFQIADDFLDLWGDDGTVGKTLGTDIHQGKMTLPLIRLMQTASSSTRQALLQVLQGPPDQRLAAIRPLLDHSDAQAYTRDVAQAFQQQAVQALRILPDSTSKQALAAIAHFSVHRRF